MRLPNNKILNIAFQSKELQTFPEQCIYSCSKADGAKRTFELHRKWYEVVIFSRLKFKILESIGVRCQNCGWKAQIPAIFARKIFKNGLNAHILIRYSKSKILSSRALNVFGGLWRVLLVALAFLIVLTIFDYRNQAITIGSPKVIQANDVFDRSNLNKYVEIIGKADFSLSFYKRIYRSGDQEEVLKREVYFPLFLSSNSSDFIIVKGGQKEVDEVLSKSNITNLELVRNQDYSVRGELVAIDELTNTDLRKFFLEELPRGKGVSVPNLMINASDTISLGKFILTYIKIYAVLILLLCLSIFIQVFIDKKLQIKVKNKVKDAWM